MNTQTIQIVRYADKEIVDAELVTGLRPGDLAEVDRHWLPTRQRIHRWLRDRSVPQSQWPQNGGWDWKRKSKALQLLAIRGFGIRVGDDWQAVAMINVAQYFSRLPNSSGKPLVYLDYLEVAPLNWPEKISGNLPMYGGCGSLLLRQAVLESNEEGYHGRVGLHSLDQSRSFYERHGMHLIEIDATKENLAYYEFTKEIAKQFLLRGEGS